MLQGDADAADMITFQNIDAETSSGGHIRKRVKVPLPPIRHGGENSSQPQVQQDIQIEQTLSQLDIEQDENAYDGADTCADADNGAGQNDRVNKVNQLLRHLGVPGIVMVYCHSNKCISTNS